MKTKISAMLVAICLCMVFTGCGETEESVLTEVYDPIESDTNSNAQSPVVEGISYTPVTIDNNDVTSTYEKAPDRVIVLDYPSAEIIAALGLTDKVIALAPAMNVIDEVLDQYKNEVSSMPLFPDSGMTQGVPNLEMILSVNPDMVIGTSYSFTENNCGMKEDYIANKINMYAMEGTYVENPTLENLYNGIRNIGKIFNVEEKADVLIKELKAREAAVVNAVSELEAVPVFIFDYNMGEGVILTVGGTSFEDYLIKAAGGKNVFDDIGKAYAKASLEEIIARNAESIVVTSYYVPEDGEDKVDYMKQEKGLANISAVKNDSFIIVSGIAVFPSLQNIDVLETIAKALHPEAFN